MPFLLINLLVVHGPLISPSFPSLLLDDETVNVTSKTVHTEIGSDGSGGGSGGSDTGLIVGIAVIGGLFALTLFGIAGFAIYKRRK